MDAASREPVVQRPKKRTGTSKYDFIQVKVVLGEKHDHYYILSRFLICRMLTVTKIPYIKAVKIALELKKTLVDANLRTVAQSDLEARLFDIMRSKGYGEEYVECYRLVARFYAQRQPLVILIGGTAWTGKSTIAQQLAGRINVPNILQTDVVCELLRSVLGGALHAAPLWARPTLGREALLDAFRQECALVRRGLEGDLAKTLTDGKALIVEGLHLDPGQLLVDFRQRGRVMLLPAPPPARGSPEACTSQGQGLGPLGVAGVPGLPPHSASPSLHGTPPAPLPLPGLALALNPNAATAAAAAAASTGEGSARRPTQAQGPWSAAERQQGATSTSLPGPPLPTCTTPASVASQGKSSHIPGQSGLGAIPEHAEGPAAPPPSPSPTALPPDPPPWRPLPHASASATTGAAAGQAAPAAPLSPHVAAEAAAASAPAPEASSAEEVCGEASAGYYGSAEPSVASLAEDSSLWGVTSPREGEGAPQRDTGTPSDAEEAAPATSSAHDLAPPFDVPRRRELGASGAALAAATTALGGAGAVGGVGGLPGEVHGGVGALEEKGPAGGAHAAEEAAGWQPRASEGAAASGGVRRSLGEALPGVVRSPPGTARRARHPPHEGGAAGGAPSDPPVLIPGGDEVGSPVGGALPIPASGSGALEPLFVPIYLAMEGADHELVAAECLEHQGAAFQAAGSADDAGGRRAALVQARCLQSYLCSYQAQGLPVVRVQYGHMGEALDAMHDYVLHCIRSAMAR